MARKRQARQPMKFYTIHYQGERPYVDGDYIEIAEGKTTLQAAQQEAEEGDMIVEWTRSQAWKVKPRPIELIKEEK